MFYKPKVNDIVLIKYSNTLAQVVRIYENDVSIIILKCHVKEREGEKGHLAIKNNLKLIWRRKE